MPTRYEVIVDMDVATGGDMKMIETIFSLVSSSPNGALPGLN
jgi:hypothetical protein